GIGGTSATARAGSPAGSAGLGDGNAGSGGGSCAGSRRKTGSSASRTGDTTNGGAASSAGAGADTISPAALRAFSRGSGGVIACGGRVGGGPISGSGGETG